jgi:hypothetical protein
MTTAELLVVFDSITTRGRDADLQATLRPAELVLLLDYADMRQQNAIPGDLLLATMYRFGRHIRDEVDTAYENDNRDPLPVILAFSDRILVRPPGFTTWHNLRTGKTVDAGVGTFEGITYNLCKHIPAVADLRL